MIGLNVRFRGLHLLQFRGLQFRLTHKIAAIGLAGIAGAGLLGAIYLLGSSSQERLDAGAKQAQSVYIKVSKVSALLLESRRAEKDFLLTSDAQHSARLSQLWGEIESGIEALRKEAVATGQSAIAGDAEAIGKAFATYADRLSGVIETKKRLGLNENSGLEGALRKSVHVIETRLKDFDEPRLTILMLMMRRHEKDFMLRRQPKYGEDLKKRIGEFAHALTEMPLMSADDRADMRSKLSDYERDFGAWMDEANALLREQRESAAAYGEIELIIEGTIKRAETTFADLSAANEQSREATSLRMHVSIVLVILVMSLIAFFIGRAVSRPIKAMTRAMGELANGNFDVILPGLGRKDEIGAMAQAVDQFKVKAEEKAQREAEEKRTEEERTAVAHRAAMIALADQFEGAVGAIVERVSSASAELEACSAALSETAQTTQQLSLSVTATSEQASGNVQSVAGATEEMAASVGEIARQVHESSRIATEAVAQARKTDGRIAELTQAATRIGDVVALITAIAEQTNLLALNATIEAARAGEAGRGFAVVASEVKQLASQTAKATEEIGAQVASMQSATNESVQSIKEIGGTIGRISEIANMIAAAVEEQGAVTKDIARNVEQASAGTSQVVSHIAEVNRGASETGSASAQVLTSAQSLAGESSKLKLEVGRFLETVRAA